eukprot:TRINITY_DN9500_c0_g1_i1.p1 TRINITY_DN9500_c0_g1~~TRINITY_DN9500_c0_g1_i1.p1  ORF type:complete len:937 (+),score=167.32 TRINITY_DN9500_c0_g1_i1:33-2813(+)
MFAAASLINFALAASVNSISTNRVGLLPELDLEPFEDDDCIEAQGADVLMELLQEACDVFDEVLVNVQTNVENPWAAFDTWATKERIDGMHQLAPRVLGRPYCEPGKVAWMATQCIFLLRQADPSEAFECAKSLDEDLLEQMTPRAQKFTTRLHLVLRSPWPALRLLDLLVRLYPENGSTRMGACRKHKNWQSEPDQFDWPYFRPTVLAAVNGLSPREKQFELRHQDGPLSRQYKARWHRILKFAPVLQAMQFSDDVFDAYREHHYRAGCHLGVISSYVLQVMQVNLRDVEGRMQRYTSSVAQLINLHAPFHQTCRTDWPIFRLLHFVSLLQRALPSMVFRGADTGETTAPKDAARALVSGVEKAIAVEAKRAATSSKGAEAPIVFLTCAWGWLSDQVERILARWSTLFQKTPLVLLARDAKSSKECAKISNSVGSAIRCVSAPQRMGVEAMVAKYLALAAIARMGCTAVWLDLDIFVASDPTSLIRHELARKERSDLVFARHLNSESVSPSIIVARNSQEAVDILMGYAGWLRENPFLLDHQGWDQFLENRNGDFAGGFDYKGRNITIKDDDGPPLSFLPPGRTTAATGVRYSTISEGFGSGDGWLGHENAEGLVFFHFWGAAETQAEMFDHFYPHSRIGFNNKALDIVLRYRREVTSGPQVSALLGKPGVADAGRPMHLVAVSYAHGCCQKSLAKNRKQALQVGADEARAYGKADLGPTWIEKNEHILSQKRGAGWWLWKPRLILQTLKDPAVPWHRGVVLWVDAGNFLHADPRPLLSKGLHESDVTALRLKWCLEAEWTSDLTLERLNTSSRYSICDRPQLGAYFLAFRKSELSIKFVEEWLKLCEDQKTLLGRIAASKLGLLDESEKSNESVEDDEYLESSPNFNTHQADQSVFSVLFKEYGFKATSLEEGHRVVSLARWRE